MMQKKICLLGAFAVGKTSLVARFVKGQFSDQYLTTVGFKVDRKPVSVAGREVNLFVWDLAGEDEFQKVQMSYLRGADGYLLVADGTRSATLETARLLNGRVVAALGALPFVLIINKSDLAGEWEIDDGVIAELTSAGWRVVRASAKTGAGTEEAFTQLAESILSAG